MSFARLAPLMSGLRLVALDLPGHGLSAHRPPGVGYSLLDYVADVLQAAQWLGWERFAVLGHSLGAIVAQLCAAALPTRVTRLALIDGLLPYTTPAAEAPGALGAALEAELVPVSKRPARYASPAAAVTARFRGGLAISREAAALLVERGLTALPDGYGWRADPRLRWPSRWRLTPEQAQASLAALPCPTALVVAESGQLVAHPEALALAAVIRSCN